MAPLSSADGEVALDSRSAVIHPTASVSAETKLAPDVSVGPFAVIEGPVTLAQGCKIGAHSHLIGPLSMGAGNTVGVSCLLGAAPQHIDYDGSRTAVEIGEGNTFRARVTVHRGMQPGPGTGVTRIGHRNLFMDGSHVGHDSRIGNDGTYGIGTLLGGHVESGDGAVLAEHAAVHQFCRMGRLVSLDGKAAVSTDVPPFWVQRGVNVVCGVNVEGMRRAGISEAEIEAVEQAFRMIYIERLGVRAAVARMELELGYSAAVRDLTAFIRSSTRGICGAHRYIHHRKPNESRLRRPPPPEATAMKPFCGGPQSGGKA